MMVELIAVRTMIEATTAGTTETILGMALLLEGAFLTATEMVQTIGGKITKEEIMAVEIGWTTEEVWRLLACMQNSVLLLVLTFQAYGFIRL